MRWPVTSESWAVVARDDVLRRGGVALAGTRSQGVAVLGPAGVGRSRIGDELASRASVPVLYVPATRAAATMPFGAFASLLPSGGLGDGEAYVRLQRATDAVLGWIPTDGRAVVYVDDAHLLDDASAALLLQLGLSPRVSLLVTVRPDEPQPDALVDLWKDNLERIDLGPLDLDGSDAMVAALLGAPIDRAGLHRLHDACAGNPLALREVVTALRSDGSLSERNGLWLLEGPVHVPERLSELTERRLSGLSSDARHVLELVALGEPLGRALVVELELLDGLGELERLDLVREVRDDRRIDLRLAHPLHREVARDGLGAAREVAVLKELIGWLRGSGARRGSDAARIAAWTVDAGEPADPDALVALAADAGAGGDLESMARFGRLAERSGGGAPAAFVHGLALDGLGRHEEAEAVFAAAEPRAVDPAERARLSSARADNLFRGLARAEEAAAALGAAAVALDAGASAVEEPLLAAQAAVLALFDLRYDDALAGAEPLLHSDDDVVRSLSSLPVAMVNEQRGRYRRAEEAACNGLAALRRVPRAVRATDEATCATAVAKARLGSGDVAGAVEVLEPVLDRALRVGDRHGHGWAALGLGTVLMAAGRWRRADALAREAAAVFESLSHPFVLRAVSLHVEAASLSGDLVAVRRAVAALDACDASAVKMSDLDVERARAWAQATLGDAGGAELRLRKVVAAAVEDGRYGIEAGALHDLIRLGSRDPDQVDRLRALREVVDGALIGIRVDEAEAMLRSDGSQLDDVAARFGKVGFVLYAAEAANEAAIAHRSAGDPRAATASARRMAAWSAECDDARTPMLSHGTAAAALTRREREVAQLASTGRSSRQIADELFLSTRTVDNHLQRTYEKLGISSRAELAEALAASDA